MGRGLGAFNAELSLAARLSLYENDHGYQAGDRYALRLDFGRGLGKLWSIDGGLLFAHETTETWSGHVETEGNLGRSDVYLSLGTGCALGADGRFFLTVQVPLWSEATGEQVDVSPIVVLGFNY